MLHPKDWDHLLMLIFTKILFFVFWVPLESLFVMLLLSSICPFIVLLDL
jgi:hypothetical protein